MDNSEKPSPIQPITPAESQRRLTSLGKISFWIQVGLGVLALIPLLFFLFGQFGIYRDSSSGAWLAFWVTISTLSSLAGGIFYAWRFLLWGRPSPTLSVTAQLQPILYISLVGILLSLIGLQAQIGELVLRLLSRTQANQVSGVWLLATNGIVSLAHFVNLLTVLWINGILDRKA
ncbi:MAG: DUF3611 family protein [Cyanobacteriota bacterium]|nr:DUF3611 family protein [Cyanobacteriota bacterium]